MSEIDLNRKIKGLLFAVRRSSRYHQARRRFFDRNQTLTSALTLIFGSAAIYTVLKTLDPAYTIGLATLVTAVSIADLVVGNARKARLHHDLARDFVNLESEIVKKQTPSEKDYSTWSARRLEIEGDEPPIKQVLDILMHNKVCLAMGREDRMYKVGSIRRAFAHFIDINPDGIRPVKAKLEESKERKPKSLVTTNS